MPCRNSANNIKSMKEMVHSMALKSMLNSLMSSEESINAVQCNWTSNFPKDLTFNSGQKPITNRMSKMRKNRRRRKRRRKRRKRKRK